MKCKYLHKKKEKELNDSAETLQKIFTRTVEKIEKDFFNGKTLDEIFSFPFLNNIEYESEDVLDGDRKYSTNIGNKKDGGRMARSSRRKRLTRCQRKRFKRVLGNKSRGRMNSV